MIILLGLTSSMLHAQTVPPSAGESSLPEVRVKARSEQESASSPVQGYRARRSITASKTDTTLAETPQSVTVITRDQIEDQGATSLNDILLYAAGARASAYGVDSRGDWIRVRGADPVQYLDGLQLLFGYNNTPRPDPYSMERVELLRGPASVLYGQGSTGGLLNMVSKRPLAEAQREIGLQLGSFNRRQLQADFTGPLSDDGQWLYRLIATVRKSDTQVDHVPDDRLMLAPSLTWKPNSRTSLTLQAHFQQDDTGSSATFLPWSGVRLPNPNGTIPTSRFISEPGFDEYTMRRKSLGWLLEHHVDDDWTIRQNARYTRGKGSYQTLYPLSNFLDPTNPYVLPDASGQLVTDPAQRNIIRAIYINKRDLQTLTLDQNIEGRVVSGALEHRLLAGLDYSRYKETAQSGFGSAALFDVYAPVYGNFTIPALSADADLDQRQLGIYLQDQIKFGPHWQLTAGLRRGRVVSSQQNAADERDSATTKRLALMYHVGNGWSPYIAYSESFQPVAGLNFYGQRYTPQRGEQNEIGVRFTPADEKLSLHAAVYDLKEKNRQVSDPTNPLNQLQSGQTKTRGLELEAKTSLGRQFDLIAQYNYTDLDKQLEALPKHVASAWGKWRFQIAGLSGFSAGLGVRYMSAFRNDPAPTTPALTLMDAMLGWDNGSWRYALNVTNLTDKVFVSTCLGRGDCWYGARRNVMLTGTYRF
ncbi:TonB-dependent siderophore receptor [Ampullimonas aquatilis]|uniref:TonB-dependent siderophore receptor n=1 Tax=Ampullimonas aquatilis TaxID=1341549 RepID=UPI003C736DCF